MKHKKRKIHIVSFVCYSGEGRGSRGGGNVGFYHHLCQSIFKMKRKNHTT